MKRLDRYVLRQIGTPALLAFAVIGFIGAANELRERVRILPLDQVTLGDLARLIFFFLPALVSYVVPITFMMGILIAFGRMAQYSETVAMRAAGIPLKRIVAPIIVTGALLSIGCFFIQDQIQTWATNRAYDFIYVELPVRTTLDQLPAGVMHDFHGLQVYFADKDARTGTLEKIDLRYAKDDGIWVYHADTARLIRDSDTGRIRLLMTNVHVIRPLDKEEIGRIRAPSMELQIPKVSARSGRAGRRGMTLAELLKHEHEIEQETRQTRSDRSVQNLRKARWEIADRLSMPFACLTVSFVAAPLGIRAKRAGRSYSFAAGFVIIVVYYLTQMLVEPKSLSPLAQTILRAWAPNAILCAAGLGLLWRVDRV